MIEKTARAALSRRVRRKKTETISRCRRRWRKRRGARVRSSQNSPAIPVGRKFYITAEKNLSPQRTQSAQSFLGENP
jgi:hypothetical protein